MVSVITVVQPTAIGYYNSKALKKTYKDTHKTEWFKAASQWMQNLKLKNAFTTSV